MGDFGVHTTEIDTLKQALCAAEALADVKGKDIIILDLSHLSTFADYFVVATGDSHVHMKALADRVRVTMAQNGTHIGHSEGHESKTWILLDFGNVIIHVFSPAARNYYGLEQLWGDAKTVQWTPKMI